MNHIEKAEEALDALTKLQLQMHDAWRNSQPSLADTYNKRAIHVTNIAMAYIELAKVTKDTK